MEPFEQPCQHRCEAAGSKLRRTPIRRRDTGWQPMNHRPGTPVHNVNPRPCADAHEGSATLTDDQARALTAGQTYFNVHTAAHPSGEVRGQVVKAQ
ncbi:MAG: CHRD domain-containing protein [Geminicoccaceae bacterium]